MQKIISLKCPKCNNTYNFYKYGKDKLGFQKYQCRVCKRQFAPDNPRKKSMKKYPPCPMCGKSLFLHHDYRDYSNFRYCDKKCNHSFLLPRITATLPPSVSNLLRKSKLKMMWFPFFIITTGLYQFFSDKNFTRTISFILNQLF